MAPNLKAFLKKLGRLDKLFLFLLALALVLRFAAPASAIELLADFAAFVVLVLVAFKWLIAGMRRLIWRLRYRLVVAYLFIAVVPIALILVLVGLGLYALTGQVAAYLVTTELERRTSALFDPARGLAWTSPEARTQRARWIAPYFWERFQGFELLIQDEAGEWRYPDNAQITAPPAGWGDAEGLVDRNGAVYLWAHAIHESTEVTMLAPLSEDMLASLVPNLGHLSLVRRPGTETGGSGITIGASDLAAGRSHVPPALGWYDITVPYAAPVKVAIWNSPGKVENAALFLMTRFSAVLRTIFGQNVEWQKGLSMADFVSLVFSAVVPLLILVELVSVFIGIQLTRSITRAVHSLYEGTQKVRVGDFAHRIEVRGNDQLAELGVSFNRMTENLERLVEVAKEKERLQSEIEIAREVQNQLFPRDVPVSPTLQLTAACRPARLVSGDYYDYVNLEGARLALAVGDVAGKGISAALLMATVQSTMRTQLRMGRGAVAAAAGGGSGGDPQSTAGLGSRLNQQLYAYTSPEKYATFFFAIYDGATGMLTYTNAGHLPPILVRNGSSLRLQVTGTVVGAFDFSQYEESTLRLEAGDLLACFTDGITEPENEFGEMFGEDRLAEVLIKNASRPSEEIVQAIMESVRHWTGSPELQDDMTLLLARRI